MMFRKKLQITKQVHNEINKTIGHTSPESGGILGSSDGGRTVDHYYFDHTANTTGSTYTPDITAVNKVISGWNDSGIQFVGFIHSHPHGHTHPSSEDILYAKRIMEVLT